MLSSSTNKRFAIAVTAACLAVFASEGIAAPVPDQASSSSSASTTATQCQSLGTGPLGYNTSGVGIYASTPPNAYLTVEQDTARLYAASTPLWEDQTMFEFFNCSYTPAPYQGKGATNTWQGYIKAPDGNCVTVNPTEAQGTIVATAACQFDASKPGGVDASQHFQIQLNSFFDFYSADFLGATPEPDQLQNFGAGGNYHFNLARLGTEDPNNTNLYLTANYFADSPQTGDRSEMLAGWLGSQYVKGKKQFPACKMVKQGAVVLVNDQTGESSAVTIKSDNQNAAGINVPVLNGTQSYNGFEFYQCDSAYMGYTSDETNFYGHLVLRDDAADGKCLNRQSYVNGPDEFIFSTTPYGDACGTTDGAGQLSSFFHLNAATDGYEITFLGATALNQSAAAKAQIKAASDATYGWTTERVTGEPNYDSNEVVLNANPSSHPDVTNYKLRFA